MNQALLKAELDNVEVEESNESTLLSEVLEGLQQTQKQLPCKYFYDEKGSLLFEAICLLDEYYITRTELAMLRQYGEEIAQLIGEQAVVIEPGSGAGEKIQLLLNTLHKPSTYIPIEISAEILQRSSDIIQSKYPSLSVFPVEADFTASLDNVKHAIHTQVGDNRCLFFPGSTLGNFSPKQAVDLLAQFKQIVGETGCLLVGVDRLKSLDIIKAAYNDAKGVTAAFNKNILHHINNELETTFSVDNFSHEAIFNEQESRIEMHLISEQEQTVYIDNHPIHFQHKETIHTENSYKYSDEVFAPLVAQSGLTIKRHWLDDQQLFSLYLLTVQ